MLQMNFSQVFVKEEVYLKLRSHVQQRYLKIQVH